MLTYFQPHTGALLILNSTLIYFDEKPPGDMITISRLIFK